MDISLRPMENSDFDDFICLEKEVYFNKSLLETDSQKNSVWEGVTDGSGYYCAIIGTENHCFLGYCAVKNMEADIPEISIELLEKYRKKGVGYKAVCALMKEINIKTHKSRFLYKVEPDNYESLLLLRKLKGTPYGLEKNIFLEDRFVPAFEKAMAGFIDEKQQKIAEAFGCDAVELLSRILVFQIELDKIDREDGQPEDKEAVEICSERKLSRAIRVFGEYMWLNELLNIINTNPDELNEKLGEILVEIENRLKKLKQIAEK